MPPLDPIAIAVPLFFIAIAFEAWLAKRRGLEVYRLNDAVSDLSAGVAQQVIQVLVKSIQLGIYIWVYENSKLMEWSASSLGTWLFTMIAVDFAYYWWHRASHEINLFWATHEIHHSSEDYNLAVALRQGIFTPWSSLPFYLPLAIIGIPPIVWATSNALNTLYQFWIHTELVRKLSPFWESWLNTPSHHRVHHGINPQYLDKNYAGILIIWDRMFGSWEPEVEPVVYGLVKPLESFHVLWGQFHYFAQMKRMAGVARNAGEWLSAFFKGPEWKPEAMGPVKPAPKVSPETFLKHDPALPESQKPWLAVQFLGVIAVAESMLLLQGRVDQSLMALGAAWVIYALCTFGGVLERRRWAIPLEMVRCFGSIGLAIALFEAPLAGAISVLALGSAFWAWKVLRDEGRMLRAA